MPRCHHRLLIFGTSSLLSTWIWYLHGVFLSPCSVFTLQQSTLHHMIFFLLNHLIACPRTCPLWIHYLLCPTVMSLARLPFQAKDVLNILSLWPPYTRLYSNWYNFLHFGFCCPALGFVTTVNLFSVPLVDFSPHQSSNSV